MGAYYEEFRVPGHLSQDEATAWLKATQERNAIVNGTGNPYSGDCQTVDRVVLKSGRFYTHEEASELIDAHAVKWKYLIAIHVADTDHLYTLIGGWLAI